jgi:hypothetical protein
VPFQASAPFRAADLREQQLPTLSNRLLRFGWPDTFQPAVLPDQLLVEVLMVALTCVVCVCRTTFLCFL